MKLFEDIKKVEEHVADLEEYGKALEKAQEVVDLFKEKLMQIDKAIEEDRRKREDEEKRNR
jgi:hypothetical protein